MHEKNHAMLGCFSVQKIETVPKRRRELKQLDFWYVTKPVLLHVQSQTVYKYSLSTGTAWVQSQPVYSHSLSTVTACVHVTACVQSQPVYSHSLCTVTACVQSQPVYSHSLCTVTACVQSQPEYSHSLCTVTACVQSQPVYSHSLSTVTACVQSQMEKYIFLFNRVAIALFGATTNMLLSFSAPSPGLTDAVQCRVYEISRATTNNGMALCTALPDMFMPSLNKSFNVHGKWLALKEMLLQSLLRTATHSVVLCV